MQQLKAALAAAQVSNAALTAEALALARWETDVREIAVVRGGLEAARAALSAELTSPEATAPGSAGTRGRLERAEAEAHAARQRADDADRGATKLDARLRESRREVARLQVRCDACSCCMLHAATSADRAFTQALLDVAVERQRHGEVSAARSAQQAEASEAAADSLHASAACMRRAMLEALQQVAWGGDEARFAADLARRLSASAPSPLQPY